MKPYYNTVPVDVKLLREYVEKAANQQEAILEIFELKGCALGPSEVWEFYRHALGKDTPLTSIRRAITNLTEVGKLEKTAVTRIGPYGRHENLWRLNKNKAVQLTLL